MKGDLGANTVSHPFHFLWMEFWGSLEKRHWSWRKWYGVIPSYYHLEKSFAAEPVGVVTINLEVVGDVSTSYFNNLQQRRKRTRSIFEDAGWGMVGKGCDLFFLYLTSLGKLIRTFLIENKAMHFKSVIMLCNLDL